MTPASVRWFKKTSAALLLAFTAALASAQAPSAAQPENSNQSSKPAQPRHEAGRARRPHSGDWLRKYKEMPLADQEKALSNDADFNRLPPERQQKLRAQLRQFNNLPPEQKERVLRRMKAFDKLTPEQQQRARDIQARMRNVPAERRAALRAELRDLRRLDAQQREQSLNSERTRGMFNENERSLLRELVELPIGPGLASRNGQPATGVDGANH